MSRVGSQDVSGYKLIEVDLSNCKPEEAILVIQEATNLVKAQARNSVLLLTDVTNAEHNKAAVDAIKDFAVSNTPYVKASAVIGIDAAKKPILSTVQFLTLHEIRPFESREEAHDWLIKFV